MISLLSVGLLCLTCGRRDQQVKDYVTLSGKIANANSDSLSIYGKKGLMRTIKVDDKGSFSDTLKVEKGKYRLFDGKEYTNVYLKNGYDLNVSIDAVEFDETLEYSGSGAKENNYLADKMRLQDKTGVVYTLLDLSDLEISAFEKRKDEFFVQYKELLSSRIGELDSLLVVLEQEDLEQKGQYISKQYEDRKAMKAMEGRPSPVFTDYENHKGGELSLADLKGKYVYIDIWATWCGPCIEEMPFLKKVEEEYHEKNIAFVSISIDRTSDYEKWRQMVTEKELTGVQLYAKGDRVFADAYKISVTGIPRFILIDPEGKVVSTDAPRPSSEELKKLFEKLNV